MRVVSHSPPLGFVELSNAIRRRLVVPTAAAGSRGRRGAAPCGWSQQAAARPSGERDERRLLVAAAVEGVRAARMEAAAATAARAGSGTSPGSASGRTPRAVGVRNGGDQRLGVRVQRAAPRAAASAPVSTIRRGTSPTTASATWRTIARSCEISSRPSVELARQARRAGSRAAPAPTRRATRAARRARSRTGRRRARGRSRCAGAGRRRTRAGTGRPRSAGSPTSSSSSATRRRAPRARRREPVRELAPDLAARVERRVRVLEDELQPHELARAARAGASGVTGRPSKRTVPAAVGTSPTAARARRRLAAARLADEPDDLAARRRSGSRRRPRAPAAAAALVVDDDVAQLERAHRPANGSTGQARRRLADGDERRHLGAARVAARSAQRGWKAQPGGIAAGRRRRAADRDELRARAAPRDAAARRAARACTGGAAAAARPRARPDSTTRPA